MTYGDAQDVEGRTRSLLALFSDRLPPAELEDMEFLAIAGESAVAFENLCVQLYEHDVELEPEALARLAETGDLLGVDPSYWQKLATPPPRPDLRP